MPERLRPARCAKKPNTTRFHNTTLYGDIWFGRCLPLKYHVGGDLCFGLSSSGLFCGLWIWAILGFANRHPNRDAEPFVSHAERKITQRFVNHPRFPKMAWNPKYRTKGHCLHRNHFKRASRARYSTQSTVQYEQSSARSRFEQCLTHVPSGTSAGGAHPTQVCTIWWLFVTVAYIGALHIYFRYSEHAVPGVCKKCQVWRSGRDAYRVPGAQEGRPVHHQPSRRVAESYPGRGW